MLLNKSDELEKYSVVELNHDCNCFPLKKVYFVALNIAPNYESLAKITIFGGIKNINLNVIITDS